jgi:hypothetical protein
MGLGFCFRPFPDSRSGEEPPEMSELPVRAIRARSVILRHWTAAISIGIRVDTSKFIENALTLCIAKYLVEFAPNVLNQKAHPTALTKEES